MKFFIYTITVFLAFTTSAIAEYNDVPDSFKIGGNYINRKCIEQLHPKISESNNIIIQAVVLETCQGSNLAFEGRDRFWHNNNTVGYSPDDPHDNFSYSYEGQMINGDHILSHGSSLALYRIEKKYLAFDISENDYRTAHVLSKVGEVGFFHCFQKVEILEDTLLITRRIYYPEKPRARACDDSRTEEIKIDLRKLK